MFFASIAIFAVKFEPQRRKERKEMAVQASLSAHKFHNLTQSNLNFRLSGENNIYLFDLFIVCCRYGRLVVKLVSGLE